MTKSRTKTYQTKSQELAAKEKMLLDDLDTSGGRLKKIALWSLGAGLIGLVFWGLFSAFSSKEKKPKKKKSKGKVPKNYPIVDSWIEQVAPKVGDWILKEFKNPSSK